MSISDRGCVRLLEISARIYCSQLFTSARIPPASPKRTDPEYHERGQFTVHWTVFRRPSSTEDTQKAAKAQTAAAVAHAPIHQEIFPFQGPGSQQTQSQSLLSLSLSLARSVPLVSPLQPPRRTQTALSSQLSPAARPSLLRSSRDKKEATEHRARR